MSDKPHLKLIACHRGADARRVLLDAVTHHKARRISKGPLRGCVAANAGPTPYRIYRALKSDKFALEFVLCIRIRLVEPQ